ncbi:helix-turn-helix domain-containing protein [Inquilinus limosus]|uniref:helix-turn-helix domain-containing protein n=1 Tax=Inquilinus limosus TaxID=171674 RepID=UPI0009DD0838|nr:AraC family transcriptional regulator [Inquilinus limosus]
MAITVEAQRPAGSRCSEAGTAGRPDRRGPDSRKASADHLLGGIPESAGPRLTTSRGAVVHAIRPPGPQRLLADHHLAGVLLSPARVRVSLGGQPPQDLDVSPGALIVQPADVEGRYAWASRRESIVVAWTRETLRELADREFGARRAELRPPPLGTVDPQALRTALLLKAELVQREVPNRLYVESLITLHGIQLLRQYSDISQAEASVKGGLPAQSVRRVREYLDASFTTKLSLTELASVAGLSTRHFLQAFTRTFGDPPHRYVIGLRLSFAEKLLRTGDLAIAEIAYLCGFSSQSHLTTSMRKHRQITPLQIRRDR